MIRVSSTFRFLLFGFPCSEGQEWTGSDASHRARTVPYVALLEPLLGPVFEFFPCKKPKTSSGQRPRAAPAQIVVGLSHALRWCAELSVGGASQQRPGAAAVRDAQDRAAASRIRPVRL